jgi:ferredoxin
MEGHGPANGQKRIMGAILASLDAVAMDAVCAASMSYQPLRIETTRIAQQRKLGEGRLENIEIAGAPLSEIEKKDWKHASNVYSSTRYLPEFLYTLIKPLADRQLRIDPVIIQEACTKCLICVKNCPAQTIHFTNNVVKIDPSKCIMCYCCHELCPYHAIKLKRSWLAKLLRIGSDE